ncbi:hypothetical protein, partial [Pseudomonas aeruginosa]|uniref:hypothetical protein n=1 Tax=Pseudomonas aeruginosa TaxID=287 RepID=UPI00300978AD
TTFNTFYGLCCKTSLFCRVFVLQVFSYRDSSFAGHPYSSEDLVLFYNAVEPVDKFVPFFDNIIVGLGGG